MGECIGYLRVAGRRIYMAERRASSEWVLNAIAFAMAMEPSLLLMLLLIVLLWSADIDTCIVPRTNTRLGDRNFAVAGPRLWNSLPAELC